MRLIQWGGLVITLLEAQGSARVRLRQFNERKRNKSQNAVQERVYLLYKNKL